MKEKKPKIFIVLPAEDMMRKSKKRLNLGSSLQKKRNIQKKKKINFHVYFFQKNKIGQKKNLKKLCGVTSGLR